MPLLRATAFSLFVVSGFCSLVYQIVWLRLAFAAFGVVTPVLSVVLSAFMGGLALGSWLAGRLAAPLAARGRRGAAVGYGLVEWGIAAGAFVVPWGFRTGEQSLLGIGDWSSASYMLTSALILAGTILVFATLMGATFPLMMAYLRARAPQEEGTFSWLYLGNVVGAMLGAAATAAVLIECLGFRATLWVAAAGNVAIGAIAMLLPVLVRARASTPAAAAPTPAAVPAPPPGTSRRSSLMLLFATGCTSMTMEVAWTRAFTPVLRTTIYAFAAVLTVYLTATWIGSAVYRRHLRRGAPARTPTLLALLFPASLLPLLLNDPRLHESVMIVLASIVPISALLGYLTPQLVDEQARGEPRAAGLAYAVNVLGCIAGPLLAGYLLLPAVGVQYTLLLAAAVYPAFLLASGPTVLTSHRLAVAGGVVATLLAVFVVRTHEDPALHHNGEVRRDHVATVVSFCEGTQKRMLVNGIVITELNQLTKLMAHLPLVVREQPPQSTLAICFGMGTTFRSLTSWGGRVTAVELSPSVPDAFGFYWPDAAAVLARPGVQIVIDDGRRFLKRTTETFDLITIDPPPPAEAGGSSLLYSLEFYRTLRPRLSPTGVLQQWFPGGEPAIAQAVVNTVVQVFPHVLVYRGFEPPHFGLHVLASDRPLTPPTAAQAIARMPAAARADMLEWTGGLPLEQAWPLALEQLVPVEQLLPANRRLTITDDRPFNEYFWLRRLLGTLPPLLADTLPAPQ
ncbi:MAG TPA: fused MFS/spermidine synthase [Planctomycetota bacterium]